MSSVQWRKHGQNSGDAEADQEGLDLTITLTLTLGGVWGGEAFFSPPGKALE